ncbi:MAG: amidohydrolase/deacetylase family metallohydrolase [Dehalococcoidales bacterium]|nr:amidohydrolase/deacetylase family metallohydrolase [Dehalococcoidales bacterium]
MARYDLLIKGGTVIDPAAGLDETRDVAVSDGRIALVAEGIPAGEAAEALDATGLVVTPGLIDFHLHAFRGGTRIGLDIDRFCLPRGVTTGVDCGSSGAYNFPAFRELVISKARSRLFCFLNLAAIGQVDIRVGELEDLRHIDEEATIKCVEANRDVILGLKVRLSRYAVGQNSLRPLAIARPIADQLGVPIMVHVGDTDAPLADILALLKGGDIVTHYLTPHEHGVLDANGHVQQAVRGAVARGVILDTAVGRLHLGVEVARKAFAEGLMPDVISTDVTIFGAYGNVRDLPYIMSSLMALGLNLEQVIERTTANPAHLLGRESELGTLQPGAVADVAAFAVEEGEYEFTSSIGEKFVGKHNLSPRLVIRAGRQVPVEEIPREVR